MVKSAARAEDAELRIQRGITFAGLLGGCDAVIAGQVAHLLAR